MIIVFSNRSVHISNTDHLLFGEGPNAKGPAEFRVATAEFKEGSWNLELLKENIRDKEPPSTKIYKRVIEDTKKGKLGNKWVFFIHGYNQSSQAALDESLRLASIYNTNILCFLWPANTGGFIFDEYTTAQTAARNSATALDRIFAKLAQLQAGVPRDIIGRPLLDISLIAHSLGNQVIKTYAYEPKFSAGMLLFDNALFHQADVDSRSHQVWMNNLSIARHAYVTLNQYDRILKVSEVLNPPRLGLAVPPRDRSAKAYYFDFSGIDKVAGSHNLATGVENNIVRDFFKQTLHGLPVEALGNFKVDPSDGLYRLKS